MAGVNSGSRMATAVEHEYRFDRMDIGHPRRWIHRRTHSSTPDTDPRDAGEPEDETKGRIERKEEEDAVADDTYSSHSTDQSYGDKQNNSMDNVSVACSRAVSEYTHDKMAASSYTRRKVPTLHTCLTVALTVIVI